MPDLTSDEQKKENKLKQTHDYIRHIFQLFLTWFTFFATLNYAALGWLATSPKSPRDVSWLIEAIAVNFVAQNLLDALATRGVYVAVNKLEGIASKFEAPDKIVPIAFYRGSVILIGVALIITAAIWVFVTTHVPAQNGVLASSIPKSTADVVAPGCRPVVEQHFVQQQKLAIAELGVFRWVQPI